MEIAYRCQREHLKITQCPDAWVTTVGPATMKGLYNQRNRWFKGGLLNTLKYKAILANKQYGDFGMIQMSINCLMFFFSSTAILFFTYYMIWPMITQFRDLYLIGFDIWPLLTHLQFKFSLLYIDIEKVLIANFLMSLSLPLHLDSPQERPGINQADTMDDRARTCLCIIWRFHWWRWLFWLKPRWERSQNGRTRRGSESGSASPDLFSVSSTERIEQETRFQTRMIIDEKTIIVEGGEPNKTRTSTK